MHIQRVPEVLAAALPAQGRQRADCGGGSPLYTFAGDTSPGQTKGQDYTDSAGTWFVVTKSGSSATTGSGGGSTGSTGGSTSSGGSWG